MKKTVLISLFLLLGIIAAHASFSDDFSVKEWVPFSGITAITTNNNIISFRATTRVPVLLSKENISLNAEKYKILEITLRSPKSYATGKMFFRHAGDTGIINYGNVEFQTGPAGAYSTRLVDCGKNPKWAGIIAQLSLVPADSEGPVEIKSVKFLEPNLLLKTKLMWQEFVAFEPITGITMNTIRGKTINDIPVNLFLISAALIFALIILMKDFKQFRFDGFFSFYSSLQDSFGSILVATLVLFVLLEARQMVDYGTQFALDRSDLFGKSLDEKRALVTFPGVYEYCQFVKKHLPENAIASFSSKNDLLWDQARYYLYPIRIVKEKSDYMLVMEPTNDAKGYKLLAKLNNNQKILVKGNLNGGK